MVSIVDNEHWRAFISKYKSLPELWKTNDDSYKHKNTRQAGWETLLEYFHRIDPNANVDTLKRRINNMRTCYRRELKKIEKSEQMGKVHLYEPTLWYFEAFEFLRDQETTDLPQISFFDTDNDIKEEPEQFTPTVTKRKRNQEDSEDPIFQQPVQHLDEMRGYQIKDNSGLRENSPWAEIVTTRDEAAIYADAWAVSYRKMNVEQRLYAKKAIEEILILGQLGQLTLNSVLINSQ